ncbi:threonine/homoserine/homoserine lactone efflux protein [Natronoflexus pectinivorans]|uniref:Threonine/homoserine/homoserine lactone efflux protein n=2 Tax=Natronoflexus pectinivorans TaxID=682526 RepID=A0A4R2G7K8_9BACT|nr:threonine/homoserine/homoserine lactone efflux protein [Natronoflexus pectinivorans]
MLTSLATIFFTSLIIAFSGAMMPGPLLTVTISESSKRGAMAGPLLITGHAILELLLITGLLLGLAPVLKHDMFFLISALLGGSIMFWMAWGMFRSLPTLSVNTQEGTERKGNLLVTGALMSLANPYWIIWWATIGIGYIFYSQTFGLPGIVFFFLGHITGDYIWYTAISTAVSKGKKLFTDQVYRILIGICGTFLVGFAVYLIMTAANNNL